MRESSIIKYTIGDLDEVFDEKANTVLALRKVAWGNGEEKLDMRKWYIGIDSETAGKGFTFLTDEGPHNLTKLLVDQEYGNTKDLLVSLKNRDDFESSLDKVLSGNLEDEVIDDGQEYFDPKEFIL